MSMEAQLITRSAIRGDDWENLRALLSQLQQQQPDESSSSSSGPPLLLAATDDTIERALAKAAEVGCGVENLAVSFGKSAQSAKGKQQQYLACRL
jgi:hypothetical protein